MAGHGPACHLQSAPRFLARDLLRVSPPLPASMLLLTVRLSDLWLSAVHELTAIGCSQVRRRQLLVCSGLSFGTFAMHRFVLTGFCHLTGDLSTSTNIYTTLLYFRVSATLATGRR